jgi:hypothetical protein
MPLGPYWLKHFDPPVCPQYGHKMLFVRAKPEEPGPVEGSVGAVPLRLQRVLANPFRISSR